MKATGLIVEYNPFHNGHKYHIDEARKITNCDVLIAVMSGNFTQRGEVSIIDKYTKTEAALNNGVDLVIELPYYYATSSANIFAKGAVELLNQLKVSDIVFGSESNNLEELKEIAETSINPDNLKEILNKGESFPKSYGFLCSEMGSNDILGIAYLKELSKTNIIPHTIKRDVGYHDETIAEIASAKAIRKACLNNQDYSNATPIEITNPHFNKDYYSYLRTILLTHSPEYLSNIYLVNEGIENNLIKNAMKYDDYEEFVNACVSRRYTRARIQRTIIQILNQVTKDEIKNLEDNKYLRVLGFNSKGREYLATLKKDEEINIVTKFNALPEKTRKLYYKTSCLYASTLENKKRDQLLLKEISGPIIK